MGRIIFCGLLLLWSLVGPSLGASIYDEINSLNLDNGITGIQSCPKPSVGELVSVFVTECDDAPCDFKRGHKYTGFVVFKPSGDHDDLQIKVTASALGMNVPLPTQKVCANLMPHQKCPLKDGQRYIIAADVDLKQFPIPFAVPNVQATIAVIDENEEQQACVSIPANIL